MGMILSININPVRGLGKNAVDEVYVKEDWGIEGDGHSGNWDRQVSILPLEALERVPVEKRKEVIKGQYTENFTIIGVPLAELNPGRIVQIGESIVKILYIGKTEVKDDGRPYIVSREGRFGRVIKGGKVFIGDQVEILD